MHRTLNWARRGWAHYRPARKRLHCALFPIVQGSMYPDLRRACAEELLEPRRAGLRHWRTLGRRAPRSEPGNDGSHGTAAATGPAALRDGGRHAGGAAPICGARGST